MKWRALEEIRLDDEAMNLLTAIRELLDELGDDVRGDQHIRYDKVMSELDEILEIK